MNETMLTLKPDTALTERDGQVGVTLHGHTRFAKYARQAEILRALIERPQPVESLMALLYARDGPPKSDNDVSLAIAEFILDFGEYLQS